MSIYTVTTAKRNIQNVSPSLDGIDILTRNATNGTFLGFLAGGKTLGMANTFVGNQTGKENTTGASNVFIGNSAGYNNITGTGNLFMGVLAGENNITGTDNIFIGLHSGKNNQVGKQNVFLGNYTGYNLNGQKNILIGYNNTRTSLTSAQEASTNNVSIGTNTKVTGNNNVVLGNDGYVQGFSNIIIGSSTNDTRQNSILIGNNIRNYGSNSLIIMSGNNNEYVNNSNNAININNVILVDSDDQGKYKLMKLKIDNVFVGTLCNYFSIVDSKANINADEVLLSTNSSSNNTISISDVIKVHSDSNISLVSGSNTLTVNPSEISFSNQYNYVTFATKTFLLKSSNDLDVISQQNLRLFGGESISLSNGNSSILMKNNNISFSNQWNYIDLNSNNLLVSTKNDLDIFAEKDINISNDLGQLLIENHGDFFLGTSNTFLMNENQNIFLQTSSNITIGNETNDLSITQSNIVLDVNDGSSKIEMKESGIELFVNSFNSNSIILNNDEIKISSETANISLQENIITLSNSLGYIEVNDDINIFNKDNIFVKTNKSVFELTTDIAQLTSSTDVALSNQYQYILLGSNNLKIDSLTPMLIESKEKISLQSSNASLDISNGQITMDDGSLNSLVLNSNGFNLSSYDNIISLTSNAIVLSNQNNNFSMQNDSISLSNQYQYVQLGSNAFTINSKPDIEITSLSNIYLSNNESVIGLNNEEVFIDSLLPINISGSSNISLSNSSQYISLDKEGLLLQSVSDVTITSSSNVFINSSGDHGIILLENGMTNILLGSNNLLLEHSYGSYIVLDSNVDIYSTNKISLSNGQGAYISLDSNINFHSSNNILIDNNYGTTIFFDSSNLILSSSNDTILSGNTSVLLNSSCNSILIDNDQINIYGPTIHNDYVTFCNDAFFKTNVLMSNLSVTGKISFCNGDFLDEIIFQSSNFVSLSNMIGSLNNRLKFSNCDSNEFLKQDNVHSIYGNLYIDSNLYVNGEICAKSYHIENIHLIDKLQFGYNSNNLFWNIYVDDLNNSNPTLKVDTQNGNLVTFEQDGIYLNGGNQLSFSNWNIYYSPLSNNLVFENSNGPLLSYDPTQLNLYNNKLAFENYSIYYSLSNELVIADSNGSIVRFVDGNMIVDGGLVINDNDVTLAFKSCDKEKFFANHQHVQSLYGSTYIDEDLFVNGTICAKNYHVTNITRFDQLEFTYESNVYWGMYVRDLTNSNIALVIDSQQGNLVSFQNDGVYITGNNLLSFNSWSINNQSNNLVFSNSNGNLLTIDDSNVNVLNNKLTFSNYSIYYSASNELVFSDSNGSIVRFVDGKMVVDGGLVINDADVTLTFKSCDKPTFFSTHEHIQSFYGSTYIDEDLYVNGTICSKNYHVTNVSRFDQLEFTYESNVFWSLYVKDLTNNSNTSLVVDSQLGNLVSFQNDGVYITGNNLLSFNNWSINNQSNNLVFSNSNGNLLSIDESQINVLNNKIAFDNYNIYYSSNNELVFSDSNGSIIRFVNGNMVIDGGLVINDREVSLSFKSCDKNEFFLEHNHVQSFYGSTYIDEDLYVNGTICAKNYHVTNIQVFDKIEIKQDSNVFWDMYIDNPTNSNATLYIDSAYGPIVSFDSTSMNIQGSLSFSNYNITYDDNTDSLLITNKYNTDLLRIGQEQIYYSNGNVSYSNYKLIYNDLTDSLLFTNSSNTELLSIGQNQINFYSRNVSYSNYSIAYNQSNDTLLFYQNQNNVDLFWIKGQDNIYFNTSSVSFSNWTITNDFGNGITFSSSCNDLMRLADETIYFNGNVVFNGRNVFAFCNFDGYELSNIQNVETKSNSLFINEDLYVAGKIYADRFHVTDYYSYDVLRFNDPFTTSYWQFHVENVSSSNAVLNVDTQDQTLVQFTKDALIVNKQLSFQEWEMSVESNNDGTNDLVISSCNVELVRFENGNMIIQGGLVVEGGSKFSTVNMFPFADAQCIANAYLDYNVNNMSGSTIIENDLVVGGKLCAKMYNIERIQQYEYLRFEKDDPNRYWAFDVTNTSNDSQLVIKSGESNTLVTFGYSNMIISTNLSFSNDRGVYSMFQFDQDPINVNMEPDLSTIDGSVIINKNMYVKGKISCDVYQVNNINLVKNDVLELSNGDQYWNTYVSRDNGASNDMSELVFQSKNGSKVKFLDTFTTEILNFTGKHRCKMTRSMKDIYKSSRIDDLIGKIVISTGRYKSLDNKNTITIDEAIPVVKMTNTSHDSRVFGVIGGISKHGDYFLGNLYFNNVNMKGKRLIIQSVGEGCIWVCNYNGELRNGDLITSSPILGFGMKQGHNFISNYTVAKITCNCKFNLNSKIYKCEEFTYKGKVYKKALVGCIYNC